jgi:ppGpp synthetase/RelA/SpoT-type nucleotidyltranferase
VAEPEAVRQAFTRVEPLLDEVQRYVRETLERYCRQHGYIFIDRQKTVSSLAEKLDGGRVRAWSDLDDLYACRIVVPTAPHEDGVVRKLDASFQRAGFRNRSDSRKAPDVFRFDGARWYGRLREETSAGRQPGVGEQLFEVQVVTAFEYAWIAVTHDLVYKGDDVDWRRLRLAAQLKAAVEQIEVLIAAFDPASTAIQESPWQETAAKTTIVDRCKLLARDGLVPETLRPLSWRRFADNVFALVRSYEQNPYRIEDAVRALLDTIDADLRGATPTELPVSGSLFQYVVSVVARDDAPGTLEKFVVVPSRELTDFYGVPDLPKAFVFDGQAAPQIAPGQSADEVAEGAEASGEGPQRGAEGATPGDSAPGTAGD